MATLKISFKNPEENRHSANIQCLLFHNNLVFSGAEDGKIKVWKEDLKYVGEIQAHENCVYKLAAIDNKLYSCSNDGTIKIWFVDSLKAKGPLTSGENEIINLYTDNGKLYSGDEKGQVLVFENDHCVNKLNVVEEVKGLAVSNNLLYTTRQLDVTVTEIQPGNEGKFTIKTSIEGSAPIQLVGDKLCVTTRDGKNVKVHKILPGGNLQMWCTITGSELIIQDLSGHEFKGQNILFSGGWDKIIKRWVISGDKPLPGGCAIVPTVINAIAAGSKGQVYVGGESGLICRLDLS